MISHINGVLVSKTPMIAVLESAGIGWELQIPLSTYEKLPLPQEKAFLYAYLHFTQDGAKLFGFSSLAEKAMFQLLISVSGVGPKIAISVISTLSIASFVRSIERGEEHLLVKVPGLGKKSAQRLIVELRDKIHSVQSFMEPGEAGPADSQSLELESALQSLGFNLKDIRRELGIMKADGVDLPLEQMIKETIKRLYQRMK